MVAAAARVLFFANLVYAGFVLENWLTRVNCPESRKRVGKDMDSVADLLIRIKNAYLASQKEVAVRRSKLALAILELLKKQGYIDNFKTKGREILVGLSYSDKTPALSGVKRVSKPGQRIYRGKKLLPSVYGGLGIAIVSTPQGIMSDREARKKGLGGEVMAFVW